MVKLLADDRANLPGGLPRRVIDALPQAALLRAERTPPAGLAEVDADDGGGGRIRLGCVSRTRKRASGLGCIDGPPGELVEAAVKRTIRGVPLSRWRVQALWVVRPETTQ